MCVQENDERIIYYINHDNNNPTLISFYLSSVKHDTCHCMEPRSKATLNASSPAERKHSLYLLLYFCEESYTSGNTRYDSSSCKGCCNPLERRNKMENHWCLFCFDVAEKLLKQSMSFDLTPWKFWVFSSFCV